MKFGILLILFFYLPVLSISVSLNFLLIIVDDLRPALNCYGDTKAFTPNIDKLAKQSVSFTRAYAQQALCAPSRNSLLTSRRPDTLKLYDVHNYWRSTVANFTTLPEHLKTNGYETKSVGKIFHPGKSSNFSDDSPYSWTQIPFHPVTDKYKNAPVCQSTSDSAAENIHSSPDNNVESKLFTNLVCPINVSQMPKKTLPDFENLEAAKLFLKDQAQNANKPFFLAVGFEKPHIPLKYPTEYLNHHPLDKFSLNNYYWPKNFNDVAYNPWNDLRRRHDINQLNLTFPWEKIPTNYAKKIIQSYYASVSYIDHLIGLLLYELRKLNLLNNTVIILTSDHGWSLGEHSLWAKYSNFEVAIRVPLVISTPRTRKKTYSRANYLVELVDLFPTIAELANISIPICEFEKSHILINSNSTTGKYGVKKDKDNCSNLLCSEGISLVPILESSGNEDKQKISWKNAVFSQYPRPGLTISRHPDSDQPRMSAIKIMGYTIRTKRFRYTAWIPFDYKQRDLNWTVLAEEVYDHQRDSDEMFNQCKNSSYTKIKHRLLKKLMKGWRYALLPYKNIFKK